MTRNVWMDEFLIVNHATTTEPILMKSSTAVDYILD